MVLIFYYNGLRTRHYLTRQGVVPPGLSPWSHLLLNADNGSFLEITGFDRPTFMLLVQCLKNTGETPGRRKRGRPPSLDFVGQVGLILLFYNSNLKTKHICLIFGIVPSVCNRYINKMLKRVAQKLRKNIHARIKWPNQEEMRECARLVQLREPTVRDVFAFADGCSIPVECSDDPEEQSTLQWISRRYDG